MFGIAYASNEVPLIREDDCLITIKHDDPFERL